MSIELTAFNKHFIENCSVKVVTTNEHFDWKKLVFDYLNCEEMEKIAKYIKDTFSNEGRYTHHLPKLIGENGYVALKVSGELIKEKIMGE